MAPKEKIFKPSPSPICQIELVQLAGIPLKDIILESRVPQEEWLDFVDYLSQGVKISEIEANQRILHLLIRHLTEDQISQTIKICTAQRTFATQHGQIVDNASSNATALRVTRGNSGSIKPILTEDAFATTTKALETGLQQAYASLEQLEAQKTAFVHGLLNSRRTVDTGKASSSTYDITDDLPTLAMTEKELADIGQPLGRHEIQNDSNSLTYREKSYRLFPIDLTIQRVYEKDELRRHYNKIPEGLRLVELPLVSPSITGDMISEVMLRFAKSIASKALPIPVVTSLLTSVYTAEDLRRIAVDHTFNGPQLPRETVATFFNDGCTTIQRPNGQEGDLGDMYVEIVKNPENWFDRDTPDPLTILFFQLMEEELAAMQKRDAKSRKDSSRRGRNLDFITVEQPGTKDHAGKSPQETIPKASRWQRVTINF